MTRVLELRAELLIFLQDAKSEYANRLCDPIWLLKIAFLADLFNHHNNLNKHIQGGEENILTAKDSQSISRKTSFVVLLFAKQYI